MKKRQFKRSREEKVRLLDNIAFLKRRVKHLEEQRMRLFKENKELRQTKDGNPDKVRELVIEAMCDVLKFPKDTLWLSDNETVFERLSHVYLDSGGEYTVLEKHFPAHF